LNASTNRQALAARIAIVALALGMSAPAQAEVVGELSPSVTAGATDNAMVTATSGSEKEPDAFTTTGITGRLRYQGARTQYGLGYRVGITRFAEHEIANSISNSALATSSFNLSAVTELRLDADATVSRTSRVDSTAGAVAASQAAPNGTIMFLTYDLNQEVIYQPSARQRWGQALRMAQVKYLDEMAGLPNSTFISAEGRFDRLGARDTTYVLTRVSDLYTTAGSLHAQNLMVELLFGVRRELNASWAFDAQAGPMGMFDLNGSGVIGPAAVANLNYQNAPWFATFTVSQEPAPNLYLGEATISDRAMLRLSLPLNKRELTFLSGNGGYTYARLVNRETKLERVFDQWNGGFAVVQKLGNMPLFASLEYSAMRQHGNRVAGHVVPDLTRQAVLLTISGSFVFGPGVATFGGR
jgi:hypothetical protein